MIDAAWMHDAPGSRSKIVDIEDHCHEQPDRHVLQHFHFDQALLF